MNDKLEILVNRLIFNYQNDNKNISNINNFLINTNLNKYYKKNFSKFKYENLNDMTFISYEREAKKYFENQHIISPDINEFKTIKYLSEHNDSVNCFLEIEPNVGVSCSRDAYIIFYDLIQKKRLLKFLGHLNGVNFITKASKNNLISYGEDSMIKIWPIINKKYYINNSQKEEQIKPILQTTTDESLKKLINLGENKFISCSYKGIYIYEYNLEDIPKINLINSLKKDKINDIILFKNRNEEKIIGYTANELFIVDLNELIIIYEIKCEGPYWKNNLIQINNAEVIFANNKGLYIIDIKKGKIKLTKKISGFVNCIFKLRDGSIIRGERDGIRRYSKNTLEELPPLIKPYDDYDENHIEEILNYLYEMPDGKIILCYSNSNIKIGILKTR